MTTIRSAPTDCYERRTDRYGCANNIGELGVHDRAGEEERCDLGVDRLHGGAGYPDGEAAVWLVKPEDSGGLRAPRSCEQFRELSPTKNERPKSAVKRRRHAVNDAVVAHFGGLRRAWMRVEGNHEGCYGDERGQCDLQSGSVLTRRHEEAVAQESTYAGVKLSSGVGG